MTTVSSVIETARSQVGYHEGRSNGHWNNIQKFSKAVPGLEWSQGQAWCSTFISWVALKAGCPDLYPRTASTDFGASWWKKEGRWSEYPAVGAQGYLGRNGDMYHTFLVVRYDATYVYTIEGNTNTNGSAEGDGVYERKRLRTSSEIQGYGYPKFPEGIKSADPKWAKAPKKAKAKKVKPRKTSVSEGRAQITKGLAKLKTAASSRTRVHRLRKKIAVLVKKLPRS